MERGLVELVTVVGEVLLEDLLARIISDLPEVIQYATAQLTYSTGTLLGGMGLRFNGRHLVEYLCANSPNVCLHTCHKISLFKVSGRVLRQSWCQQEISKEANKRFLSALRIESCSSARYGVATAPPSFYMCIHL